MFSPQNFLILSSHKSCLGSCELPQNCAFLVNNIEIVFLFTHNFYFLQNCKKKLLFYLRLNIF